MSKDWVDNLIDSAKTHAFCYKQGLADNQGNKYLLADFLKKIIIEKIDVNETFIEVKILEKNDNAKKE